MQDVLPSTMNDPTTTSGFHVNPAELAQLKAEMERTKQWVRKQQMKKFMSSFVAVAAAYGAMILFNLVLFGILMIAFPSLRKAPEIDPTKEGWLNNNPWMAYLLLAIPPICALPPFIPLVVGILIGVPLRRRSKAQDPFFMG
jgi:hypothetical protein